MDSPWSTSERLQSAVLVLLGGLAAVAIAIGLGSGTPEGLLLPGVAAAILLFLATLARPHLGFNVLAASSILLIVVTLPSQKAVNAFDVLLWPVLGASLFGRAAARARDRARVETGEAHDAIRARTRALSHAVIAFYSLAAASIFVMALRGGLAEAVESGGQLVRALQAVTLFPAGLVLIENRARLDALRRALLAGGALFAIVNVIGIVSGTSVRGGVVWFANEPGVAVASPNEAGTTVVLLWAVIGAWHLMQPRAYKIVMLLVLTGVLVLSQSRSGLLAWGVFFLFSFRDLGRRALPVIILVVLLLPFVPQEYWGRMLRTLSQERGSSELYSALVRVYSWHAAWQIFLANPLFGVGYRAFAYVSHAYNPVGVVLHTAESLYMETAAGMGLAGLTLLGLVFVRMFQLASTIGRLSAPLSWGATLARMQVPWIVAVLVASITGDNLYGLVGLAQLALWTAMLVRAGHLSVSGEAPA